MLVFFEKEAVNKWREVLSYAVYYCIITFLYIVVKIPIILVLANLLLLFGLTWNYHARMSQRILSFIYIFVIMLCLESLIAAVTGLMDHSLVNESAYRSISGLLIIRVVSYMAALIMNNYNSVRKGIKIPAIYWFCVVLIPLTSLYLLLVIFSQELAVIHLVTSMLVVLFMNFVIFYLYENLAKVYEENTDKRLVIEQNRYYEKQLSIMKSSLESIKALKHDMKNHFSSIAYLASKYGNNEIIEYLSDVSNAVKPEHQFSSTGNTVVDSVLNFKLHEASKCGVSISIDIAIHDQLKFGAFDMTTILGNLLDNAINGIKTIEDNRKISILISSNFDQLAIIVKNTFDGKLKKRGARLVTTQYDETSHGYGMESINRCVKKYNGIYKYECVGNEFISSVMLFSN